MQPVLLTFSLDEAKAAKIRMLCMMLKIRFRPVNEEEAALPIGLLAGVKAPLQPQGPADPVQDEMLVMAHFDENLFNRFLDGLRAALPPIPLKAVLTPTNASWTGAELVEELKREREAIRQKLQKK